MYDIYAGMIFFIESSEFSAYSNCIATSCSSFLAYSILDMSFGYNNTVRLKT